ncbi:MAG: rod shape-determining protein RodA [Thermoleophilia bacterium]|nr:rod shape-determining protein RodA [Thermoleophilia bacterium]
MIEYAGSRVESRGASASSRDLAMFVRSLDWVLLATVVGLVAYGLWAIEGITRYDVEGDRNYFVVRQALFAAIGSIGLLVALVIDPERYRRHARALFATAVGLLLLVIVVGEATRGSRRWIELGSMFRFQPSEFGKVLVVLFLAAFLASRGRRLSQGRTVAAAVGLGFVPVLLVFVQPDFGTAIVYLAVLGATLFFAGVRWAHLGVLAALAVIGGGSLLWGLPSVGVHVLKPYQEDRILSWRNPGHDPSGSSYNVDQSIVAVGSGGVRGKGVEGATQTNLDYLPEHATDFVFASLAEQRGFVGASALLLLYLLLLWRGIRIVSTAPNAFSAIVAGGIVFALLTQIFINVGMTMGIAPVTGIPLPFVSVGGSSMISNLVAVGLLEAIHVRGRLARRH